MKLFLVGACLLSGYIHPGKLLLATARYLILVLITFEVNLANSKTNLIRNNLSSIGTPSVPKYMLFIIYLFFDWFYATIIEVASY